MGFIPVLPAADKILSKYPAAARVGITPTPTVTECCKRLSISGIACIRRRDGAYPRPTNSGQDTKQIPRSSEGGDKSRPYDGRVLQAPCISGIACIRRMDGVYPRPTNSGQDTKQIPRSSEGGDKPHPYGGRVLHNVAQCREKVVECRATLPNAAKRRSNAVQRCQMPRNGG